MTVGKLFEDVSARLLEEDSGLEQGRMMRAEGLKAALAAR